MLYIVIALLVQKSHALPVYAAKHRITQCTACHISPYGGGLPNLNGKYYGARGYDRAAPTETDKLYADWRFLYFKAQHPKINRDGSGIMEAVVGGQVPLSTPSKNSELKLVANHSFTGFASSRDTYLQFQTSNPLKDHIVNFIQVGRLQPPFGFRTDEHRTYTRMISQTSWNDFVVGLGFSGDPFEPLHYDLVVINGESGPSPDMLANEKSGKWGSILNFRWTSPTNKMPIVFGTSVYYANRAIGKQGWADSAYLIFALNRWIKVPLVLSAEFTESTNLNNNNSDLTSMVGATYLTAVADSKAFSYLIQLDWDLSSKWVVTYKMDQMTLDRHFPADYFVRHGIGFRYYWGPNVYVSSRFEIAKATPPSESPGKNGADDAFWTLIRASF